MNTPTVFDLYSSSVIHRRVGGGGRSEWNSRFSVLEHVNGGKSHFHKVQILSVEQVGSRVFSFSLFFHFDVLKENHCRNLISICRHWHNMIISLWCQGNYYKVTIIVTMYNRKRIPLHFHFVTLLTCSDQGCLEKVIGSNMLYDIKFCSSDWIFQILFISNLYFRDWNKKISILYYNLI